eukprot:TRINITY_DN32911_c0_g1_i1.p1 TRINITY_DN32911_c0_g1~~TRINITY_DN32911_c0_g1_i1.p1  ORF type:complete len:500 (-),score=84.02 TRINITY_DN32911_c0_g1_i1:68-1567(-)
MDLAVAGARHRVPAIRMQLRCRNGTHCGSDASCFSPGFALQQREEFSGVRCRAAGVRRCHAVTVVLLLCLACSPGIIILAPGRHGVEEGQADPRLYTGWVFSASAPAPRHGQWAIALPARCHSMLGTAAGREEQPLTGPCAAAAPRASKGRGSALLLGVAGAVGAAAAATAQQQQQPRGSFLDRIISARAVLIVLVLIAQKCLADGLTWHTKARLGMVYSGADVTLVSEILKFPLLAVAIAAFCSPSSVVPTFRTAATEKPFAMVWVGAAYAAQNLLYFLCLQHISAAAYQVLSQSKVVFTALSMCLLLGTRFTPRQLLALALLVVGATATQLGEVSTVSLRAFGGNAWLGCALTVLSALLSALPNVVYERLLKEKEGQNQWAANLQLTTWIFFWVSVFKAAASGEGVASIVTIPLKFVELCSGFTPLVWCIVVLKTLNCIIIPICLKYADNIMYGYAKPASIVITCLITSLATSTLPAPLMLVGIATVLSSMVLYGKG